MDWIGWHEHRSEIRNALLFPKKTLWICSSHVERQTSASTYWYDSRGSWRWLFPVQMHSGFGPFCPSFPQVRLIDSFNVWYCDSNWTDLTPRRKTFGFCSNTSLRGYSWPCMQTVLGLLEENPILLSVFIISLVCMTLIIQCALTRNPQWLHLASCPA